MALTLYHDKFIQSKEKMLQSKKQNTSPRFVHGTLSCSIDLLHFLQVVNYKIVKLEQWEPFSTD